MATTNYVFVDGQAYSEGCLRKPGPHAPKVIPGVAQMVRPVEAQASPNKQGNRGTKPANRIRQAVHKMNQLEQEWFNILSVKYPNYHRPRAHAKTYILAPGVRYTPDVSASCWPDDGETPGPSRETCWEVKGKRSWDDAIVKIKVAAHEFPEIRWIFVDKVDGQWREQEMLA